VHGHKFNRLFKQKGSRQRWACDTCPAVDAQWYRYRDPVPPVGRKVRQKRSERATGVADRVLQAVGAGDLSTMAFAVTEDEYDHEGNRIIKKMTPLSIDPGTGTWHTVVETSDDAAAVIANATKQPPTKFHVDSCHPGNNCDGGCLYDDPQPVFLEEMQTGTARVSETPRALDEVHTEAELADARARVEKPLHPLVPDDFKDKSKSLGKKPSVQDSTLIPGHTADELEKQTLSTLRNYASELDIRGRSKMDRPNLVEAILNAQKGSKK
jgi:hypothetical protein